MLLGALALGRPRMVAGIEIDPVPHDACVGRLPELDPDPCIIRGSAFQATLRRLPVRDWDVVITNPPYVRTRARPPRAKPTWRFRVQPGFRKVLFSAALVSLETLEPEDKRLFAELAHGYSGFADLAVPSWILCAALVREGGRLAMVVPNTWLTRDYAQPIQYLLHRWFNLTCVVEDFDATWFSDALVRTNLVVATRVGRRDGLGSNEGPAMFVCASARTPRPSAASSADCSRIHRILNLSLLRSSGAGRVRAGSKDIQRSRLTGSAQRRRCAPWRRTLDGRAGWVSWKAGWRPTPVGLSPCRPPCAQHSEHARRRTHRVA